MNRAASLRIQGFTLALALAVAPVAGGQDTLRPGDLVTLMVPARFATPERPGLLDLSQRPVFVIRVTSVDGRLVIGATADWQTDGFPALWTLRFDHVTRKQDYTEVKLRDDARVVKVRFASEIADVDAAFRALAVTGDINGPAAKARLDDLDRQMAARLFTGPLDEVPAGAQLALVRAARESGRAVAFRQDISRGGTYLIVDLGRVKPISPVLQPNQLGRVANAVNDELLGRLKAFWRPVSDWNGIDGMKIEALIPHAASPDAASDRVEWWAPRDLVAKFAADEIASQALVDGSVVIVNGNRVQLVLATPRR